MISVSPFHDSYDSMDVEIATAATLWHDPETGRPIILIINEALFFGDELGETLLNPNQMRDNGLIVEDAPRQYDNKSSHTIFVPASGTTIPLRLDGIVSCFDTTRPTWEQYEDESIPHVVLTSDVDWEPRSAVHADREEKARSVGAVRTIEDVIQNPAKKQYVVENTIRHINAVHTFNASRESCELMAEADDFDSRLTEKINQEPDRSGDGDRLAKRLVSAIHIAADDSSGDGIEGHRDEILYPPTEETIRIRALSTSDKRSVLTPAVLAKRWHCSLEASRRTMQVTTQSGIRNVLAPGERKLRQRLDHLRYPRLSGKWYSDTWFSTVKSARQYNVGQLFTNGLGFDSSYPQKDKGDAYLGLNQFIRDYGIPETLVTDGAKEETLSHWLETCRRFHIDGKQSNPYSQWRNLSEAGVRELKKGTLRATRRTGSPRKLWCYCSQWVAAIRRLTALDLPALQGRTPTEYVLGSTPDISEYALFDWYQPVKYIEPTAKFPFQKTVMGRWLGVAENSVDLMSFYIMKANGEVLTRKSVWSYSEEERQLDSTKQELSDLDEGIKKKHGDSLKESLVDGFPQPPDGLFDDDEAVAEPEEPELTAVEADEYTSEAYDEYLTAEVMLPHGGEMARAKVISRKRDQNGLPVGRKAKNNPMLDSRMYEVEYADGSTEAITANLIAENLYSQVDSEGRSHTVIREIVDHRKNGHAIAISDGYYETPTGQRRRRRTTKGWDMLAELGDGSTEWIPVKELKESLPVQLAEYAVSNKLDSEPAFAWWVYDVLRRRDRIISKVKSRYWKRTHKYGIELPKTVKRALEIDAETGTTFWKDAIDKEMKNVMPAFEFSDTDEVPIGHKHILCHLVFDIKLGALARKARYVAGGHMTDPPKDMTYSSVVSRDSVRIAFLVAALNDLDVLAADVQNAYLNAPTSEKVYATAGLEFGSHNVGRPVKIVRALYGLKSSGARWRDHMAASLRDAGYFSCKADPDVWMKAKSKPSGERYWSYVLCYVDDLLVVDHNPQEVMEYMQKKYTLKDGSVKEPDLYLGNEVTKWNMGDVLDPGKECWAMSSDMYVKRAVSEVEKELGEVSQRLLLPSKVSTPMSQACRPEIDGSKLLPDRQANYYQGLIGVLRWICELGRIDILVDVSMMSRFLAAPREGHLEQVLHIFAYLKKYDRSKLVFDDEAPVFEDSRFAKCDWDEFYPGAEEVTPPDAPEVLGKSMIMSCFVDADHAGCRVTRRSHSGILLFLNKAPIMWYSKRQNTVETSTFGSEIVALKIAVEMTEGLRYKLRMMGIAVDGPTNVFCDNESVVKNTTRPESTLKKKHNAIAYHRVREAQAAGIVRISHEPGETNLADLLTKCLPGPRLRDLVSHILW